MLDLVSQSVRRLIRVRQTDCLLIFFKEHAGSLFRCMFTSTLKRANLSEMLLICTISIGWSDPEESSGDIFPFQPQRTNTERWKMQYPLFFCDTLGSWHRLT
jgi:hypothetical protein